MKILVTGANGYLGQGIVEALLELGHQVVATDFFTNNVSDKVKKFDVDIFGLEDPFVFFEKPDVLLHLAWKDGFVHYSDAHIEELPKHYHFIKKMVDSGIAQIAVLGSMHEIGFFEGCINENTPCHPITPYGIGKNALRDLVQMLCQKKETVFQWFRGYYIVGNASRGSSIFSKLTAAAREGKKVFPFTMGVNQYDFLDYPKFCELIATAVSQKEITGIIEICSGKPTRLCERVEQFIIENNLDIKLEYGAFPDRPYDSKAIWGNNSKIQEIMDLKRSDL